MTQSAEQTNAAATPVGFDFNELAVREYLAELKRAALHGEASFSQAYMALYISGNAALGPSLTAQALELHPKLLEAFETTHGRIEESRYGHNTTAGAVLTRAERETARAEELRSSGAHSPLARLARRPPPEKDQQGLPLAIDLEAFVWWQWVNFDSRESNGLLSDVLHLRDRITTFLPPGWSSAPFARDIALRQLFGIVSELIQAIDEEQAQAWLTLWEARPADAAGEPPATVDPQAEHNAAEDRPQADVARDLWVADIRWRAEAKQIRASERHVQQMAGLRKRLAETTEVYLSSAQRLAQRAYVNGMFRGLGVSAAVLVAFAVVTALADFDAGWVATATAGAVGAVLSVLQRMAGGPLELKPEGEKETFQLLGALRPVIGALLGMASFVLVSGGLVDLTSQDAGTDSTLYFAAIAFLAGFSERFAQDMLVSPAGLIKKNDEDGAAAGSA